MCTAECGRVRRSPCRLERYWEHKNTSPLLGPAAPAHEIRGDTGEIRGDIPLLGAAAPRRDCSVSCSARSPLGKPQHVSVPAGAARDTTDWPCPHRIA